MTALPELVERCERAEGEVLPPRSVDAEAAALLDELDKLQTLMVLQSRQGRVWIAAADLVQRTRILIIERCALSKDKDDG